MKIEVSLLMLMLRSMASISEPTGPVMPARKRGFCFNMAERSIYLVRFDNNKYSVEASAVGRPVEVHAYADRIVIRQDDRMKLNNCLTCCHET